MTTSPPADLHGDCDSEPIHRLGRTQRFGVLLAFDRDGRIHAASANARAWCGVDAAALPGTPVTRLLPRQAVAAARAHAEVAARRDTAQQLFGVRWPGRAGAVDVSVHASGGLVVVEAEPAGDVPAAARMAACPQELADALDVQALAESAARAVARLTGYDRVMVYRFAADGSGTVVAEQRRPGMTPFLGLRYPATDIPEQARLLYLRNPIRIVADAGDDGLALACSPGTVPDLSLSTLRSVAPTHLQYMRNMGTAASMSVSLIIDGRLWGLIACHHRRPMRPPLVARSLAEVLGRLYSLAIARVERRTMDADLRELLAATPDLRALIDAAAPARSRDAACAAIGRLLRLGGVAALVDGRYDGWGRMPTAAQARRALAALQARHPGERPAVRAVESLAALQPSLARLCPDVAGMLAVPLSADGEDALLLLRGEVTREITWGGDPSKAVGRDGGRLTPRASFEAWREAVRGHCEPWSPAEVELGGVLRTRLLELRVAHREQRELQAARRAARQQALLVRELNHRVRNMLGLIQGLVEQTALGSDSVADLSARLQDRVHAMSRAYTEVEKARWQPTSLRRLIDDETRAFAEPGQVSLDGEAVDLEPAAYLAFALVVHELATNARKYGALSRAAGRLHVAWTVQRGEGLVLDWTETGGPPVHEPAGTGFGSRVIAEALSHQLRGHTTLRYEATGLRARLFAPRGYRIGTATTAAPRRPVAPPTDAGPGLPATALVVEDDFVIAVLAETMLRELGCAQVTVAGTLEDALAAMRRQRFGVAVLDVNLGSRSSEPAARRLAEQGVPTVVATGYSDTDDLPPALRRLPRLGKPYAIDDLRRAVSAALAAAG